MEIIHRRDGAQATAPVGYALESARKQAGPAMRRARCRVRLGAEDALQPYPTLAEPQLLGAALPESKAYRARRRRAQESAASSQG